MKIIKKEKETDNAEISKDGSVQGKEMSPSGEAQGQRSRHRSTERVPAPAAKNLKPKEPTELREGKSSSKSGKSEAVVDKVKNKKKGKGFTDFLNSLIDFGF